MHLSSPKKFDHTAVNPLMSRLKPHSNGLLHSNTVIGTLVVDGWAVPNVTAHQGYFYTPLMPPG